jgi:beta-glucosidase-like glycosyl hydrolase
MKYLKVFMVLSFSCLFFVSGCVQTPEEKINDFVKSLTLEEMVGQTLMVGFRDSKTRSFENANAGLKDLIKKYKIGNVILFKDNFNSKLEDDREFRKSVFDITHDLQTAASESQAETRQIPLFVAVDQEGGVVVRVDKGVTQVPAPMYIGASRKEQYAYDAGRVIGSEMKMLGFNMILAPVADININTDVEHVVIGRRSFGAHKDIVIPLCVQFMNGLKSAGMISVGKHFPGHGNTEKDPHYELPELRHKLLSQLMNIDIAPFKKLIDNGIDAIMTSHLLARPLDTYPVTISEKANKDTLRKKLGFKGLIIADDFSVMKGILKDETGNTVRTREEATTMAYDAGNDIIIYGWIENEEPVGVPIGGISRNKFDEIYKKIIDHFKNDKEHLKELFKSVKRIITAKTRLVKIEDFNEPSTWQTNHYNDKDFLELKNKNEEISKNIEKDSVVLISERGNPCNNIAESTLFRDGKGPLNDNRLSSSDKILLVSPEFIKEELKEAILNHEKRILPKEQIETTRLLWIKYGWYEKEQLDDASASGAWETPLKPLAKTNSDGDLIPDAQLIDEKAKEIVEKAKDKRLIVFGAAEKDHIKILECLINKLENLPIKKPDILVLLFREPYLIPKGIYDNRNVSVLFLSSIPDMRLAADLLYGKIKPKPVDYLPLSIPGSVDRSTDMGASIIPCPVGKCPKTTLPPNGPENNPPILLSLLSGLIGAALFFVIPKGKLKWVKGNTSQYNWTDLFWDLMVGLAAAVILYFLTPFLRNVNIQGFGFVFSNKPPLYILTVVVSFFSPALWLNFIGGVGGARKIR